jgi:hypothetical protein
MFADGEMHFLFSKLKAIRKGNGIYFGTVRIVKLLMRNNLENLPVECCDG